MTAEILKKSELAHRLVDYPAMNIASVAVNIDLDLSSSDLGAGSLTGDGSRSMMASPRRRRHWVDLFLCEINAFDAEFFETSWASNQLCQGDPSGTRESSISQADVVILACGDQVCVSSPDLRRSWVGVLTPRYDV
jgi:hypothetical protein